MVEAEYHLTSETAHTRHSIDSRTNAEFEHHQQIDPLWHFPLLLDVTCPAKVAAVSGASHCVHTNSKAVSVEGPSPEAADTSTLRVKNTGLTIIEDIFNLM